jgi:hypothetical protein
MFLGMCDHVVFVKHKNQKRGHAVCVRSTFMRLYACVYVCMVPCKEEAWLHGIGKVRMSLLQNISMWNLLV